MRKFELFIFCVFLAQVASADICSDFKCKKYTETEICVLDPDLEDTWDPRIVSAKYSTCGFFVDRYVPRKIEEFESVFRKLASECKKIKTLRFFGHGAPGYHGAGGGMNTKDVLGLEKYNCLMADGAHINLLGCNTGKGCHGEMMMYALASTLLPKGGSVSAPSTYAFSVFGTPAVSQNFSDRTLKFDPKDKPPDKWSYNGAALRSGKPFNENCADELGESLIERNDTLERTRKIKPECSRYDDAPSAKRLSEAVDELRKADANNTMLLKQGYNLDIRYKVKESVFWIQSCLNQRYSRRRQIEAIEKSVRTQQ